MSTNKTHHPAPEALKSFVHDFVARHSNAHHVDVLGMERLGGGAIQENYALDLRLQGGTFDGNQQWVLRTDSPSRLPMSLGRAEEFSILREAFKVGVKVPEPLFLHRDEGELGKDFYLMRRVAGNAGGKNLVRIERTQKQRAQLLGELGASLGQLHSITPSSVSLGFLGMPAGNPALYRVEEYRTLLDRLGKPQPTLEWALRWLELNAPTDSKCSLVHGDFRTGNYMVEQHRLTGILDWEFSSWSSPQEDIGWFSARCWRFGALQQDAGGIGPLEELLTGYRSITGATLKDDTLPYWRVMAAVRWAVIALFQAQRHLSGEQTSLELALTGRMLPEIELDVVDEIAAVEKAYSHA
ncbi:phosphotransferase family protein [Pseudomonas sp. NFX15]|uniref:phosphotransferase family protein n=1 Tax=Pseudomonas sp. NFX15 TaxID=2816958 RepID=UPI003B8CF27D